jgi:hypothetical protein
MGIVQNTEQSFQFSHLYGYFIEQYHVDQVVLNV